MLMKITRNTFAPSRIPAALRIGIAVVITTGVVVGGVGVATGIRATREAEAAHTAQVKQEAREQKEIEGQMFAAAENAKKEMDAAAEADYQKFLADKAAAELKAQAEAQAAIDLAKAQADAEAAAKSAVKAPVKRASGGGGGAPGASGSPIPFVSDPNEAGGGHYDTTQCASGSGSTINGVPLCD